MENWVNSYLKITSNALGGLPLEIQNSLYHKCCYLLLSSQRLLQIYFISNGSERERSTQLMRSNCDVKALITGSRVARTCSFPEANWTHTCHLRLYNWISLTSELLAWCYILTPPACYISWYMKRPPAQGEQAHTHSDEIYNNKAHRRLLKGLLHEDWSIEALQRSLEH